MTNKVGQEKKGPLLKVDICCGQGYKEIHKRKEQITRNTIDRGVTMEPFR